MAEGKHFIFQDLEVIPGGVLGQGERWPQQTARGVVKAFSFYEPD